jgi:formamidopyrimidine-DNA glycosylase
MPELPEVETMRRGIAHLAGRRIVEVEAVRSPRRPILITPRGKKFSERTCGQQLSAVERHGKRVVLRLECGDAIVIEPRMTGLVLVADPPTEEHLRFRVRLEKPKAEILFWDRRGLGTVRLFTPAEFERALGPEKLGPDALGSTSELLRERLGKSRREIKVALLDQRALAGVGNLYASEILHLAGVHPQRRCDQLKPAQWQAIHAALVEVLELAIRYEGSTLGDGTYRNALNEAGSYQNHHRVYDRAGQVCSRCAKATVVRIVQAQRSTFFCPKCQPAGRKRSS